MVESSPSRQRRPPCKTNKEMSDEAADAAALTYLLTVEDRPVCCALLALWCARCSTRTFGVQSCGAPSLCAMAWAALASAVTVGGSVGSATWGTMPVSVGKFHYVVNIPGWWALWVSGRVTASGCIVVA